VLPAPVWYKGLARSNAAKVYRRRRDRLVRGQAKALHIRIRSILKSQMAAIVQRLHHPFKQFDVPITLNHEMVNQLWDAGRGDIAELLTEFLNQTAAKGGQIAGDLVNASPDLQALQELLASHVGPAMDYIAQGAGGLAQLYPDMMRELLSGVAQGDFTERDVMEQLQSYYDAASARAEGVARTEVAYAAEAAAMATFTAAGVAGFIWDFGGGPCSTGVCEDLDGVAISAGDTFDAGDFGPIDGPPAHPNCTCAVLPADQSDLEQAQADQLPQDESGQLQLFPTEAPAPEAPGLAQGSATADTYLGGGVNASYTGTANGEDVVIKPAGEGEMRRSVPEGTDPYREAAAYQVNQFLDGRVNAPEVVVRNDVAYTDNLGQAVDRHTGADASVQTFIQGQQIDVRGWPDEQLHDLALYDSVVGNMDRHNGNSWLGDDGAYYAIDHGLAFPDPGTSEYTSGNFYSLYEAENRGLLDLSDADRGRLEQFMAHRLDETKALSATGLEPEAIEDTFDRVQWMLDNGSLFTEHEFYDHVWR
jgi:hypothetical protein